MNGLFIATILDKIKWNDETAQEPKRAISVFPSLIWEGGEGGGGQGFPFILSKIVRKNNPGLIIRILLNKRKGHRD